MEQKQPAKAGFESAENAVSGFYHALSMGNGSLAVQFLIPEKQETGNYVSTRMTEYYGSLEKMLKVERIERIDDTKRRVVYSYKERNKEKCEDIMDVNATERSDGWYIESIVPRQVCQAERLLSSQPLDTQTLKSEAERPEKSQVLVCQPSVKYYFDVNGAEVGEVGDMYSIVSLTNELLSRCEKRKSCDHYKISISKSGMYTNIQPDSINGMLMKISDTGLYMEFATIGFDTVAYYGQCKLASI